VAVVVINFRLITDYVVCSLIMRSFSFDLDEGFLRYQIFE